MNAWRARRRLDRLGRALRRRGWAAEPRYAQAPPMLRVFSRAAPCIGDAITVARGSGTWWFRSSTGALIAPCAQVERAADRAGSLLAPWVAAALTPHPHTLAKGLTLTPTSRNTVADDTDQEDGCGSGSSPNERE